MGERLNSKKQKRMGKFLVFMLGVLGIALFFSPLKVVAADGDVVINEVYPFPNTGEVEWIELYNDTNTEISLVGYTIEDGTNKPKDLSSYSILAGDYLILRQSTDFSFQLNNSGDTIILKNIGTIIDQVAYGNWNDGNTADNAPAPSVGQSIARTPNGQDTNMDSDDFVIEDSPTPGGENPEIFIEPPLDYPEEILDLVNIDSAIIKKVQVIEIIDGDTVKVSGLEPPLSPTIRLLYADTPEEGLPFFNESKNFTEQLLGQDIDLLISEVSKEQIDLYDRTLGVIIYNDKIFNTELLSNGLASFYDYDNSIVNGDAWLSLLQEAQQAGIGLWENAGKLVLSELLPDPVGDDAQGEWVEIYNPNNQPVDLSRFLIDQYLIPSNTKIAAAEYKVFYRTQTAVALSNGGDTVKLLFPGGLLLDEQNYTDSSVNLSWARKTNGSWAWTEKLTPGAANIIYIAPDDEEDGKGGDEIEDLVINTAPVAIKTGEFRNFENYLVQVRGTVVSTSGNTFYLDDGTGQAKIYIQEKTGIDKPPMHKGDIFEIIGIVNLYRSTWRILPQKQADVKLIEAVQNTATTTASISKKSSSATNKSATTSISAQARAPTEPLVQAVKAATDTVNPRSGNAIWIQLLKVLIGMALIMLVILIIKVRQFPKIKVIGGHFGEDET